MPPLPGPPSPYPPALPGAPYPGPATRFTVDRVVRLVLGALVLAGAVWVVWYFVRLIVFLMIGMVLAYLMRPLMYRLEGLGLGRLPAIMLTFVLVLGGLGLLLTYLVPAVAVQVADLSQQFTVERIRRVAATVDTRISAVIPVQGKIEEGVSQVFETLFEARFLTEMAGSVVDVFTNIFYAVIVIPFITFFFLKDGARIRNSLLRLVPNRYFEVTIAIVEKVETNMGRYLRALVLQSVAIAGVASALLAVVGLDYAVAVGLFTGLANTIPYFGPFIGLVAGTIVGITQTGDFSMLPGVLLAMGLTQVADNLFIQPLIFSRAARMHPLVILFVVLIGAQLAGIVGMLLAIPLAATVRVVAEQVLWSVRNYRILRGVA